MQPATLPVLSWMPASEQAFATPCGGEHLRNLVIPTTPRMIGMPATWTPRSLGGEHSRNLVTPTTRMLRMPADEMPRSSSLFGCQISPSAEAPELERLLKMQTKELMNLMESLMLRQENLITSLLTVQTRNSEALAGDSGAKSQDCKSKVETNAVQTQIGIEPATKLDDARSDSSAMGPEKRNSIETSEHNRDSFRPLSSHRNYTLHTLTRAQNSNVEGLVQTSCLDKGRRDTFKNLLGSRAYDIVMTLVIVFNAMLMIADTDANAGCYGDHGCEVDWIWYTNLCLLLVYTTESLIVIDVYRWKVLKQWARSLEILVVVIGFIDILVVEVFGAAFPSFQILKLVRLTRIFRGARLFNQFPELQSLMMGLGGAMKTMLWGIFLLTLIILFQAIFAVELMYDLNKEVRQESQYCEEALDSVWNAALLFFQILVAADSWGQCTLAIIKHQPPTFILLGASTTFVWIGFMNLIMSVIIERVAAAREEDTALRMKDKERQAKASRAKWLHLFEKADEDGSGELSLDEVMVAFDALPDFHNDLKLLGIERSDLPNLLTLMDEDRNQQLGVNELLSTLDMVWNFDNKFYQVAVSMEMRRTLQRLKKILLRSSGVEV